jgi:hypothetical protein
MCYLDPYGITEFSKGSHLYLSNHPWAFDISASMMPRCVALLERRKASNRCYRWHCCLFGLVLLRSLQVCATKHESTTTLPESGLTVNATKPSPPPSSVPHPVPVNPPTYPTSDLSPLDMQILFGMVCFVIFWFLWYARSSKC